MAYGRTSKARGKPGIIGRKARLDSYVGSSASDYNDRAAEWNADAPFIRIGNEDYIDGLATRTGSSSSSSAASSSLISSSLAG